MKGFYLFRRLFLLLFLLAAAGVQAQTGSLSGKVFDAAGQPLPGASVKISNSNKATVTNADGGYSLTGIANGTYTVTAVYIGYSALSLQVTVAGAATLNFNLKEDAKSVNEVVIVGYGTQNRRELTGSIAKIESAQLQTPAPSFESALQGKAAGVAVTTGSGIAGSSAQIRIRGIGSISGGAEPLYVIDGIPMTSDIFSGAGANGDYRVRSGFNQNPLATLNPNDIESVEILKDAGAAGIYGSRGANGVVLITTKRGKTGKPTFNFSTREGFAKAALKPEYTNNVEWLQLRQEAWTNDGNTGLAPLPSGITWANAQNTNTDWWDLLTRTGFDQDYNLSANGGTSKFKYFFGGNYSKNQSYLLGNSYDRISGRLNIDYDLSSMFSMNLSSSWAQGNNQRVLAAWAGGLGDAMSTALPIFPVRVDPATNGGNPYFFNGANPIRSVENTSWRTLDTRSITNLYFNFKPVKDLVIRAGGGLDYNDATQDRYQSKYLIDGATPTRGESLRWPVWTTNYNANVTATYTYNPNADHKMSFLLGGEYQHSVAKQYSSIQLLGPDVNGTFYNNKALLDLASRTYPNNALGVTGDDRLYANGAEWAFASAFARINYTLKDKYILQGVLRTDGSSRFGSNNKYGFFPSVSAAWIISDEDFMKDASWLSLLKLRAGYGITGNANIESDRWRQYYLPSPDLYGGAPIIYPTGLENPDLKWETMQNIDLALEFGVFKGRITGEVAYYNKLSEDVLLSTNIPTSNGFSNRYANLGKIRNNGVEFSFISKNIENKNFSWTTNFNIATNTNKILDVSNLPSEAISGGTNDTRVIVGYPVGTNFLVRYVGVDPADGNPIWLDKAGNKTKTYNLDNRVPVGKVTPDFFGGFTNTFRFKNWDLSGLIVFMQGADIWDNSAKFQFQGAASGQNWVVRKDFLDRWQKPGDNAKYPRMYYDAANIYPGVGANYYFNSTMFLYDGSYLKLRELTLGYTLPATAAKKLGLNNARLYFTGTNLFTATKYPGGDPEVARDYENVTDRNMSANVTYLTPPQQRTFMFGLNINF